MENQKPEYDPPLSEVKRILREAGLNPTDYKHLPYEELKKLAGVR